MDGAIVSNIVAKGDVFLQGYQPQAHWPYRYSNHAFHGYFEHPNIWMLHRKKQTPPTSFLSTFKTGSRLTYLQGYSQLSITPNYRNSAQKPNDLVASEVRANPQFEVIAG